MGTRSDIADGIKAVLDAYAIANPTLLARAYRARPSSITAADLPAAFIAERSENVGHSMQIRTRTMTFAVVIIRRAGDNLEDAQAFDNLVDGLMEAFTAVPQFAPITHWDALTVADEEYAIGDFLLPAVRFTFTNATVKDGRA